MLLENTQNSKKYQIILADPPWSYRKSGGIKSARGLAKKFYTTMDIELIKSLNVQSIVDKNCYLFLWVTAPCIQEGLDVLKSWGFVLFTIAFTWIKMNTKSTNTLFWGMGNATRANPEYILLGRKGRLKFGGSKNSAPFPSCIVIFKKEVSNG